MPYQDEEKRKAYQKKWNAEFYKKNKVSEYARIKARRVAMRGWLDEFKSKLSCAKCGETHPACLDFHHKDNKTKEFSVGNVSAWGWGKEKMLREIEKCVVLCSNCHRKAHYKGKKSM